MYDSIGDLGEPQPLVIFFYFNRARTRATTTLSSSGEGQAAAGDHTVNWIHTKKRAAILLLFVLDR